MCPGGFVHRGQLVCLGSRGNVSFRTGAEDCICSGTSVVLGVHFFAYVEVKMTMSKCEPSGGKARFYLMHVFASLGPVGVKVVDFKRQEGGTSPLRLTVEKQKRPRVSVVLVVSRLLLRRTLGGVSSVCTCEA